ncbi:MAG TPA: hypothetical protein VMT95_05925 [Candidatus Binatia bacterium]|nr:hypothetical protein [Candidatus Binatia bacterium]
MRFSLFRSGVICAASALALAACAGRGIVPTSQAPLAPSNGLDTLSQNNLLSPDLTTCAKVPPQGQWIMKGACTKITLKPTGANFSLEQYMNLTVTGSIGANTLKSPVAVYIVDATDKGDIENWKGSAFPKYKAAGTTIAYAAAINQSSTKVVPKISKKPVLEYIITDSKGLPGKECSAAVLTFVKGKPLWKPLPVTGKIQGKTVKLAQYTVPRGFQLPPKTPLYFAVNCFQ